MGEVAAHEVTHAWTRGAEESCADWPSGENRVAQSCDVALVRMAITVVSPYDAHTLDSENVQ
jgi:hypothetical protein